MKTVTTANINFNSVYDSADDSGIGGVYRLIPLYPKSLL